MFISIAGKTLETIASNITENVLSWEPKSIDQNGPGNNHLRIFDPIVKGTRFMSNFIKVYPNETVSVESNPLANKKFTWMYYLADSPQAGALLYNPDADWMHDSSATFNTGNAKYIVFLVGNDDGFTGVNTWELKFKHNFNLVIGG